MSNEISLSPVAHPGNILTLENISEQTGISGYAFSNRLMRETGMKQSEYTNESFEGTKSFKYRSVAQKITSESIGGPTIGFNKIVITIDTGNSSYGSSMSYIYLYFGAVKRIKLLSGTSGFLEGKILTWDLNSLSDWLEDNITTDIWDEISLVTESKDGIKIRNINIVHSSQTILDWTCHIWLDGSKDEEYTKIVLTSRILETKLGQVNNLWVPQIHWAARELGKTDGVKYGTTEAWCSEFASWCIRKALWDTPAGNISSQSMQNYFSSIGRMFTHDQLLNGECKLVAGDYIRFQWPDGGQHSGIFIKYLTDANEPSNTTKFQTIEGNKGSTVAISNSRTFKDVLSAGNCK